MDHSYFSELNDYVGHTYIMPTLEYLRDYFEGPGAPRWDNWEIRQYQPKDGPFFDLHTITIFIIIAAIFTLLEPYTRKFFAKLLCQPFAMSHRDSTRFTESIWQMTFYTVGWLYSCFIVSDAEWASKTYLCWEPPFPNQDIGFHVYAMYVLQMGWYLHCLWCHLMHDVRKSDFWVMLAHHVVALMLLYFSFITGYHRIGILVLFCLDGCDIFLHFIKSLRVISHYNQKLKSLRWLEISCYMILLLSWAGFRLFLFAIKVLYTSGVQALHYPGWYNCDYWFGFNLLLVIIYAMQIYWFYLIILSGYRSVKHGEVIDDCRDLGEEDPQSKTRLSKLKTSKSRR